MDDQSMIIEFEVGLLLCHFNHVWDFNNDERSWRKSKPKLVFFVNHIIIQIKPFSYLIQSSSPTIIILSLATH